MLTVSARWAAQIARNHEVVSRVDAVRGTTVIRSVPVTSWQVVKDASVAPRVTATATIGDTSLLPEATGSILTPLGTRLRFYRGIRYPDGTTEMPLVAEVELRDTTMSRPDMTLDVSGADLSAHVADQLFPGPTPPAFPASAVNEIRQRAITDVPGMTGVVTLSASGVTDTSVPAATVWEGDRWGVVEQLADLLGAECFYSPDQRTLLLRPAPVVAGSAAATLYAGDGGTVVSTRTSLTRGVNYVVVWSDPDDAGRSRVGYAADYTAASPTYAKGPYGYVVAVERRPGPPPTTAVMNAAAAALLARYRSQVRTVELEVVPNPALEPGDTVAVRFFNGVTERHVVQSVTIPGSAEDTMTVTTRTTTYDGAS